MGKRVSLQNVNKIYSNGYHAVYDFSLDVKENEFVVFVGPSGCGKSTTLRMIAGLEEISSGELYLDDVVSNYLEPKSRNISMVFQNYALYPQLNVYDNIAYPLKIKHLPKEEIKEKVYHAAKILNLGPYLDSYPKQLSGGQMQRVALGRAIVKESDLFLMDEPLSNLDAKLRVQMRSEIVKIHKNINTTTIYVTHDQIEAMTMADRIVVMNKGYIQQIDEPYAIYQNPNNLFVATFIGTPPMNLITTNLINDTLDAGNLKIKLIDKDLAAVKEFYENKEKEFNAYLDIINSSKEEKKINEIKCALDKLESSKIYVKKEIVPKNEKKTLFKKKVEVKEENNLKERLLELINELKSEQKKVFVGVRPEAITNKKDEILLYEGKNDAVELLGSELNVYFYINNDKIIAKLNTKKLMKTNEEVSLFTRYDDLYFFDSITGEKILTKEITNEAK